jgi:hypothetical protein
MTKGAKQSRGYLTNQKLSSLNYSVTRIELNQILLSVGL